MSSQAPANVYGVAVGTASTNVPVISTVSPGPTNLVGNGGPFKIGQKWINESTNQTYTLTSLSTSNGTVTATWTTEGGSGSGSVLSVSGFTNQITVSPTTGNVVVSLPSAIITPGSLLTGSSLTATTAISSGTTISAGTTITSGDGITALTGDINAATGNLTATIGDLSLQTAGGKLKIAVGTNASIGVSGAISSGTVAVSTSAVTSSSIIFLNHAVTSGTIGTLYPTSIVPGSGFTITSTNSLDTSTVSWLIIN